MILSDHDLRAALRAGELGLDPYDDALVQPASIDLRLADEVRYCVGAINGGPPAEKVVRLSSFEREHHGLPFVLRPGDCLLASTVERVYLGPGLWAAVWGKSSLARRFLSVHQTAGWIDPGFRGQITLELTTALPIKLEAGMPIAQLVVGRVSRAAERPYAGRFQDQAGATGWRREAGAA